MERVGVLRFEQGGVDVSGPAFFQTPMGRRFYESTVPDLVKQIARVADALEGILVALAKRELKEPTK